MKKTKPLEKVPLWFGVADERHFTFPGFRESFKATTPGYNKRRGAKQITEPSPIKKACGEESRIATMLTERGPIKHLVVTGYNTNKTAPVTAIFLAVVRDLKRTRFWWA